MQRTATADVPFGTGGLLNLNVDGTGDLGTGIGETDAANRRWIGDRLHLLPAIWATTPVRPARPRLRARLRWTNSQLVSTSATTAAARRTSRRAGRSAIIAGLPGLQFRFDRHGHGYGRGSKWTNSGSLYVGYSGSGTLTVADGGSVTAETLYASLSDSSAMAPLR